jgi:hypothetical protein
MVRKDVQSSTCAVSQKAYRAPEDDLADPGNESIEAKSMAYFKAIHMLNLLLKYVLDSMRDQSQSHRSDKGRLLVEPSALRR